MYFGTKISLTVFLCLLVTPTIDAKKTKGCGARADVVFVLDSSGSVGASNWQLMLKFVQDVINIFTIGKDEVQVGVDIYAHTTYTKIKLNSYQSKTQLLNAVKTISFLKGGNTYTSSGIQRMTGTSFSSSYGRRPNVPKIGIIVTDGKSSSSSATVSAANAARASGIKLFAIGIGSSISSSELRGIANDPDSDFYFKVNDFSALKSIESSLASKACTIFAPTPTGCKAGADLVFLVDNSGSVGSTNFKTTLKFMSDIVDGLDVGKDKFQVGVITFHTPVKAEFNLDKYQNKKDIKAAIMSIKYEGGGTNTGSAIKYLHSTSFSRSSGHRPGHPMIGILITDGYSSNKAQTREEARNARLKGIKMFSIGVGSSVDATEIQSVASEPKSQFVFTAANFNLLKSIKTLVLSKACEVADITCWGMTDLVFVLEDSCHVGKQNFQKMLDIVEDLVQEVPVGKGNVQVGVNTFRCTASTAFQVGTYKKGKDIIRAVNKIKYTGGKVNTGKAIEYTRKNSFPDSRSKAKKMMVILTNGSDKGLSKTLGEAQKAKNSGIKVMVIGVGSHTNQELFKEMATEPYNKYVFSDSSFDPLRNMRDVLIQRKCSA
ncbi:cartilage matrix protein-like [Mytilus californianus]|uniref:cartilage matrix protein-like n=1 Tax=Mytilus californianus TaxID=6549 RepID=UPI00224685F9|nr:cartilage matrix protein-like [Mytilus californianus]